MAGRPMSFDRDEALVVAQHAFWRSGYPATSISALCEGMGINPPSLYAAFGDKQKLFDEAVEVYVEHLRSGAAAALSAPTARESVAELLRVTALAHADPTTPPGCFVLSEPSLGEERDWLRTAIARRIARGQREGDVRSDADPRQLAELLMTVMIGMSTRARDGAGRRELDGIVAQAMAAFPPVVRRRAPARKKS